MNIRVAVPTPAAPKASHCSRRKLQLARKCAAYTLSALCIAAPATTGAITVTNLNIFRDLRAANDVGLGSGDLFQFGADISGGSAGYTVQGIFIPSNLALPTQSFGVSNCGPLSVNADFCAGTVGFTTPRTDGIWEVKFTRGADVGLFVLPAVNIIPAVPVPFPTSVQIQGNGSTPTISWSLTGATPNAFRVNIFDKSTTIANGTRDIIHSVVLAPGSTSYALPAQLNSSTPGHSVSLIPGHSYAINFQSILTRDGGPVPAGSSNADLLSRSSSFFDFSPPVAGAPPVIELPAISGPNHVYQFQVGSVGPTSTTFIDPDVATGYDYAVGVGNPNFASVLLPQAGDNHFLVHYVQGGNPVDVNIVAGTQYFFPNGGVSSFRVTGIETSAMLDPTNAGAFVTGLTFVSSGSFTGTMTPITTFVAEVPEPAEWMALIAGLGLIGAAANRKTAGMRGAA